MPFFRTILKLHLLEYVLARTPYPYTSFCFVILILFLFSIVFALSRNIKSYGLLSLIFHTGNSCHDFVSSFSIGLLLLVGDHYRSLQGSPLYQSSLILDSSISMLYHLPFRHSTRIGLEGIGDTLAPSKL